MDKLDPLLATLSLLEASDGGDSPPRSHPRRDVLPEMVASPPLGNSRRELMPCEPPREYATPCDGWVKICSLSSSPSISALPVLVADTAPEYIACRVSTDNHALQFSFLPGGGGASASVGSLSPSPFDTIVAVLPLLSGTEFVLIGTTAIVLLNLAVEELAGRETPAKNSHDRADKASTVPSTVILGPLKHPCVSAAAVAAVGSMQLTLIPIAVYGVGALLGSSPRSPAPAIVAARVVPPRPASVIVLLSSGTLVVVDFERNSVLSSFLNRAVPKEAFGDPAFISAVQQFPVQSFGASPTGYPTASVVGQFACFPEEDASAAFIPADFDFGTAVEPGTAVQGYDAEHIHRDCLVPCNPLCLGALMAVVVTTAGDAFLVGPLCLQRPQQSKSVPLVGSPALKPPPLVELETDQVPQRPCERGHLGCSLRVVKPPVSGKEDASPAATNSEKEKVVAATEPAQTTQSDSTSTAEPAQTTQSDSTSTAEPAQTTQSDSTSTAEPAQTAVSTAAVAVFGSPMRLLLIITPGRVVFVKIAVTANITRELAARSTVNPVTLTSCRSNISVRAALLDTIVDPPLCPSPVHCRIFQLQLLPLSIDSVLIVASGPSIMRRSSAATSDDSSSTHSGLSVQDIAAVSLINMSYLTHPSNPRVLLHSCVAVSPPASDWGCCVTHNPSAHVLLPRTSLPGGLRECTGRKDTVYVRVDARCLGTSVRCSGGDSTLVQRARFLHSAVGPALAPVRVAIREWLQQFASLFCPFSIHWTVAAAPPSQSDKSQSSSGSLPQQGASAAGSSAEKSEASAQAQAQIVKQASIHHILMWAGPKAIFRHYRRARLHVTFVAHVSQYIADAAGTIARAEARVSASFRTVEMRSEALRLRIESMNERIMKLSKRYSAPVVSTSLKQHQSFRQGSGEKLVTDDMGSIVDHVGQTSIVDSIQKMIDLDESLHREALASRLGGCFVTPNAKASQPLFQDGMTSPSNFSTRHSALRPSEHSLSLVVDRAATLDNSDYQDPSSTYTNGNLASPDCAESRSQPRSRSDLRNVML